MGVVHWCYELAWLCPIKCIHGSGHIYTPCHLVWLEVYTAGFWGQDLSSQLSCRSLLCLLFIFRPHLCRPSLVCLQPPDWGEDIGLSMSWRSTFGQKREEEIVPNGWDQVGPLWSKRWLGGRKPSAGNTEETSRPKENIKQQTGVIHPWFMDWQML